MRRGLMLLHPNVEIAVIKWSDGSVNKFHAEDKEDIDYFIAVKTEAHEGITHELVIVALKELLHNERNER